MGNARGRQRRPRRRRVPRYPIRRASVGDRRWKQTTLKTLSGSVNATQYGALCIGNTSPVSEDCLFLNVFSPATGAPAPKGGLPVIVWIHGGGFSTGSGALYDGRNLARNAVYVSINYRLGVFGFLSSQELLAEGSGANIGLRDQELALQWVREKIRAFGGDPTAITAVGQSAGAMSIGLHMIARGGSQQLFHRAITESGSPTSTHDMTSLPQQASNFATLAASTGCSASTSVLGCLRAKTTNEIATSATGLQFRPTVDSVYIPDVAIRRVRAGQISAIPTIVGTNTNEDWGFATSVTDSATFDAFVRSSFSRLNDQEFAKIGELYPAENFLTARHRAADVFGDGNFVCPNELFSEVLATKTDVQTFRYRFNQTTLQDGHPLVIHCDELPFLINYTSLPTDTATQAVTATTQAYWWSFVQSASPNGAIAHPSWPRFDATKKQQIVIQSSPVYEINGAYMPLHNERCAFWYDVDERIASSVFQ